jgi:hypothetical protein
MTAVIISSLDVVIEKRKSSERQSRLGVSTPYQGYIGSQARRSLLGSG